MKISTKGRYALRLMVDLAEHINNGYISLKDIAERQNISKKYLEQIIPSLTRAQLVNTVRGAQGGYKLAKQASKITVGDILRETEGIFTVDDDSEDTQSSICFVWKGLADTVNKYLDSITIQDILDHDMEYMVGNFII